MTRLVALVLLLGSLLPWTALIPGGELDTDYWPRLTDWALGTALCLGVGGLVWFVTRDRPITPDHTERVAASDDWRFVLSVVAGALVLYAVIAQWVFAGRPLLIDEIVQVLQARDYASGALTHLTRAPRAFYSIMHEVDLGVRSFGQYPAGGPAMLVLGVWVGAEWLVGPVVGALSVLCFARLLRVLEPQATRRWYRGTVLLFALAPFGAFMFGSHMNHATVLLWLLVAMLGLARATVPGASRWWGLITGLGLGVAATIRPLDAAAFALPAGAWLMWRAFRENRADHSAILSWVLSGLGVAIPASAMMWVNVQTTGHPLRFGYDLLWGAGHSLGFHQAAWGDAHTPARGVELISLYLTRLSTYLFETPFPALLLPAIGLWGSRSLRAMDRYLLVAGGGLLVGYWAYWHDGFYLGPRFVFALLPLLVLWSARGVRALHERFGAGTAGWRATRGALGAGFVYAVITILVVRVPTYQNGMRSMRLGPEREAAEAGVHDAVVLVQESWGAQLMVRLWAAGITRADAELLYRNVDACRLEVALGALESEEINGEVARARLQPLLRDSSRVRPSDRSPDFTERLQPGLRYTPRCEARIAEDRGGYLLYAPWRLARDSNVYARWLPGREAEVRARFPGRAVYRVRRASAVVDAPLVWDRLAGTTTSANGAARAGTGTNAHD